MSFSELSEFVLPLLGGLALFLYGMRMMSSGLGGRRRKLRAFWRS